MRLSEITGASSSKIILTDKSQAIPSNCAVFVQNDDNGQIALTLPSSNKIGDKIAIVAPETLNHSVQLNGSGLKVAGNTDAFDFNNKGSVIHFTFAGDVEGWLIAGISSTDLDFSFLNNFLPNNANALPTEDNQFVLGSPNKRFAAIYGQRMYSDSFETLVVAAEYNVSKYNEADYADLAEYYIIRDAPLKVGVVVSKTRGSSNFMAEMNDMDCSPYVIGVVAAKPGYTMNAKIKGQQHAQAVTLAGLTPVMVLGEVQNGDIIVPAQGGYARTLVDKSEYPYRLGFACEDKTGKGYGLVECLIRR